MRHLGFGPLALLITSTALAGGHAGPSTGPTADQAYRLLIDGHTRYATNTRTLPHQDEPRRCETTTGGQHPIAAVLSCADSRVPPEMLFDQGIGDLFVIRVAGNVAAADELGTIEYGVEHLQIPLIVVLGHTRCGAVTAVVDGVHAEGNLAQLLKPIVPAAGRARHDHPTLRGPMLVSKAIQENVRQAMRDLTARSPVLAKAVETNRVKIVGGVYDIHSGRIDWLGDTAAATVASAAPAATHALPEPDHVAHSPAAPAHPHAAPPAADDHATPHAAPTHAAHPQPKAKPAEPHASAAKSMTTNWPLLGGLVAASTLIGAGITHVAARSKA
ncbi:MAG TPA: carbonic anhydrase [Tepidisphaeraceae bacterium]|jgi:carbonic anhydrase